MNKRDRAVHSTAAGGTGTMSFPVWEILGKAQEVAGANLTDRKTDSIDIRNPSTGAKSPLQ